MQNQESSMCHFVPDIKVRHHFCSKGESRSSWCKYQRDKVSGETTYKANLTIPKWLHDIIKSVFTELSSENILSKCLDGRTQNSNESLHSINWIKSKKYLC